MENLVEQSKNNVSSINEDAIANLSDQLIKVMKEMEILKGRSS
jgi:hypothetical protein